MLGIAVFTCHEPKRGNAARAARLFDVGARDETGDRCGRRFRRCLVGVTDRALAFLAHRRRTAMATVRIVMLNLIVHRRAFACLFLGIGRVRCERRGRHLSQLLEDGNVGIGGAQLIGRRPERCARWKHGKACGCGIEKRRGQRRVRREDFCLRERTETSEKTCWRREQWMGMCVGQERMSNGRGRRRR